MEIITLCHYKSNLLKKIKLNETQCINFDNLRFRLNSISNVITYEKRIEYQDYYRRIFQDCTPFQTW